jgi:hypothetical protein
MREFAIEMGVGRGTFQTFSGLALRRCSRGLHGGKPAFPASRANLRYPSAGTSAALRG